MLTHRPHGGYFLCNLHSLHLSFLRTAQNEPCRGCTGSRAHDGREHERRTGQRLKMRGACLLATVPGAAADTRRSPVLRLGRHGHQGRKFDAPVHATAADTAAQQELHAGCVLRGGMKPAGQSCTDLTLKALLSLQAVA